MKVIVSKVMAKELDKRLENMTVSYEEISVRAYEMYVDINTYDHDEDFKYDKQKFKVLRVDYPSSYYAMAQYITTRDLVKAFKERNCKTIEELVKVLQEKYEI